MRVYLEGLWLVDPSVCFSRDPKAHRARVGAWLLKEELAVGLVVTPKLWRWLVVSKAVYSWLGLHQHTGHCLKFGGTMVNALGSQLRTASLVGCLSLVGV